LDIGIEIAFFRVMSSIVSIVSSPTFFGFVDNCPGCPISF